MLTRRYTHITIFGKTENIYKYTTNIICFPFNNFKYYLTLFSKFFSSFPHGTCSLSVSCHYLALEGIYLPFSAAIPSNTTRWKIVVHNKHLITNRVLTFHDLMFQSSSIKVITDNKFYRLQFDKLKIYRFTFWAYPTSLAVTEGILVSFFSSA